MKINFIYDTSWNAQYYVAPVPPATQPVSKTIAGTSFPIDLMASLEAIRTSNMESGAGITNISFDVYYNSDKYTGIQNYRQNGKHLQNRYSGVLVISPTDLAIFV
jgi:hypothetical protein